MLVKPFGYSFWYVHRYTLIWLIIVLSHFWNYPRFLDIGVTLYQLRLGSFLYFFLYLIDCWFCNTLCLFQKYLSLKKVEDYHYLWILGQILTIMQRFFCSSEMVVVDSSPWSIALLVPGSWFGFPYEVRFQTCWLGLKSDKRTVCYQGMFTTAVALGLLCQTGHCFVSYTL